jgi:hypothetical protein
MKSELCYLANGQGMIQHCNARTLVWSINVHGPASLFGPYCQVLVTFTWSYQNFKYPLE